MTEHGAGDKMKAKQRKKNLSKTCFHLFVQHAQYTKRRVCTEKSRATASVQEAAKAGKF